MANTARPIKTNEYIVLRGKGQITIPSDVREELGWEEGERLLLVKTEEGIRLERGRSQIMKLAGSLSQYAPPENWNIDGQELIKRDKQAYAEAVQDSYLSRKEVKE
jgi:AbrB family looped-hinge helix DNA binding protein